MTPPVLCDTTLRDGEQAPGVAFPAATKVEIARLLAQAGITEIEAGTPVSGGEEAEGVAAVAALALPVRVWGWCRALEGDVDAAARSGVGGVAVAVPVSGIQLRHKLGRDPEWAAGRLAAAVAHAKGLGLSALAALEDVSRAEPRVVELAARAALEAGADRLRLSDTVGVLDPFRTFELVARVRSFCDLPLEFHGHNDFGLATANALAAWRAGATHLSVTVLGLGERAGNAALEEVGLALSRLMGVETGLHLARLGELFKAVSLACGRPIPPAKPVAGELVFTHESGIHVDGLLKSRETYEPYPPELVGRAHRLILGKHSGASALANRLAALGLRAGGAGAGLLLEKVKARAAKNRGPVSDTELIELYESEKTP